MFSLVGTTATGGELLMGPFNVSNIPSGRHTRFPRGTFEIMGIHAPPYQASEGPGFVFIGPIGGSPFGSGKGMHGTGIRPSWTWPTDGCLRCEDDVLSFLLYLLAVNRVPVSSKIVTSQETGNTIEVRNPPPPKTGTPPTESRSQ
jgi:hypothetical protein